QIAAVEKAGGRIILMASRALAKLGRSADDYAKVYNRVLGQVREPVIIHWLGDMFDPALAGYWGTGDLDRAMDIAVDIINADEAGFHDVLGPTVPLSRHIFRAPTRFYKTGIVFMAWLNGHQDHFTMVGGQESTRSTLHLAELFRLADKAGLLSNPEMATRRMKTVLATRGIEPGCAIFPPSIAGCR